MAYTSTYRCIKTAKNVPSEGWGILIFYARFNNLKSISSCGNMWPRGALRFVKLCEIL